MPKYTRNQVLQARFKRTRHKKKRTQRSAGSIRRSLPTNGMPQSYLCKHKYNTQIQQNPDALGVPVSWYFSMNSMFDPDRTGVGHQPMGFDQVAAFYENYRVVGCKIKVTPHIAVNDANATAYYALSLTEDDITTFINTNDWLEQDSTNRAKLISGNTAQAGGQNNNFQMAFFSDKKWFKGENSAKTRRIAAVGANPLDQVYARITTASATGEDAPLITFLVEMEYITLYTRGASKVLSQS